MHVAVTIVLYALLAWHGFHKGSLSISGAVAAAVVCLPTFSHPSYVFTFALMAFYLSASSVTKIGSKTKQTLEEDFKQGGQRTAVQVFANGLVGTVLCCWHYMAVVFENNDSMAGLCFPSTFPLTAPHPSSLSRLNTALLAAYIACYACCNGDTWASEIGILSPFGQPILLTTLRPVPRGTNGAVSFLGLLASAAGGAVVGVTAAVGFLVDATTRDCVTADLVLVLAVLGGSAGVVGSLVDSVLGATLQRTTYNKRTRMITAEFRRPKDVGEKADLEVISGRQVLDNHQVNFFASLTTAFIFGVGGYLLL